MILVLEGQLAVFHAGRDLDLAVVQVLQAQRQGINGVIIGIAVRLLVDLLDRIREVALSVLQILLGKG